MKQHLNEWEASIDGMIMANGNDLFVKNADKVRMSFYQREDSAKHDESIAIKGIFIVLSALLIIMKFKSIHCEF